MIAGEDAESTGPAPAVATPAGAAASVRAGCGPAAHPPPATTNPIVTVHTVRAERRLPGQKPLSTRRQYGMISPWASLSTNWMGYRPAAHTPYY
jgi:hypothetical protein